MKYVNIASFKVLCQLHLGENIIKCCKSRNLLPALGERVGRTNRLHAWLPPCFFVLNHVWSTSWALLGWRVLRIWVVGFACEGPLPSLIAIQLSDGLSTQTTTLYHLCRPILVQANANAWSTLALHWICFWRIYKKNNKKKRSCVFWCSLTEQSRLTMVNAVRRKCGSISAN